MAKITKAKIEEHINRLILNRYNSSAEKYKWDAILIEHLEYIPNKKLYKFRECTHKNFATLEKNCIWLPYASSFKDPFDSTVNIDLEKDVPEIKKWLKDNYLFFYFTYIKQEIEKRGGQVSFDIDVLEDYVASCSSPKGKIDIKKEKEFLKTFCSNTGTRFYSKDYEIMIEVRKQVEKEILKTLPQTIEGLIENSKKTRNIYRESLGVYCMTERMDNRILWETYTNDYKGYCIEYSFENFLTHSLEDYKYLAYLMPVLYVKQPPHFSLLPLADHAIRQTLLGENNLACNNELEKTLNMQLLYKNSDYESEHEWRICIFKPKKQEIKFPFVDAIYAGKDINEYNLRRLRNIANKLKVPLYKQTLNQAQNGFLYTVIN